MRLILTVAICLAITACATTPAPRTVNADVIDRTLTNLVAEERVAGISALVYEDGQEAYFGAFGMRDREASLPMTRDTIVQIYSMTKPITGVALLTLYEKGHFSLDDPLAQYLPELADWPMVDTIAEDGTISTRMPARQPTIRDAMMHTVGLRGADESPLGQLYAQAAPTAWTGTLEETPAKMRSVPLNHEPGSQWWYSDSVDLQARLVEVFSGQTFAEYVTETIFEPLGMDETRYLVPEADRSRMASLYQTQEGGGIARIPNEDAHALNIAPWPYEAGSYGLVSTLDNYMAFALMLQGDGTHDGVTILKPETVQMMRTNYLPDSVTERLWLPSKGQVGFGLNVAVRTAPPADEAEHYGTVGEFFWDGFASTLFWVDPAEDITAVLFVQIIPFDNPIHNAFRNAVYNVRQTDGE